LAELPKALGECGGGDGVATKEVDVGVAEGAEAGDVLVLDWDALGAELVDGGRQVAGVPQRDGVDDQAERGELVFLAFAVGWRIWPTPPFGGDDPGLGAGDDVDQQSRM
jgi:hypothetical protein